MIQDPEHSLSYNRYSYVWNNPTNLTDPTGFITSQENKEIINYCSGSAIMFCNHIARSMVESYNTAVTENGSGSGVASQAGPHSSNLESNGPPRCPSHFFFQVARPHYLWHWLIKAPRRWRPIVFRQALRNRKLPHQKK